MKCDFNAFKCDIGKEIKTMHEKLDMLLKQISCDTNENGSRTTKYTSTSNEEVDPTKDVLDEVTCLPEGVVRSLNLVKSGKGNMGLIRVSGWVFP
ncbi:hypothetical protein Syun_031130 [Stephania yunnanensis]|uniref:Uncharacterized protein n=1 Tax=Stephania yunnanensis TaxID=152371 RepID=A0AAP0DUN1_9MAGN